MLGVIMINRLYAMYQQSRKMLIFLAVTFLAITIPSVVIVAIQSTHLIWDEVVFSSIYRCVGRGGNPNVISEAWILNMVWEALVLCLAMRIAIKRFIELRRLSTGWRTGDCFTVLIKSHVLYFVAFIVVSFFNIGMLSPNFSESAIYSGVLRIVSLVQMFVLGPRLILSVRGYLAELTDASDEGIRMTTLPSRRAYRTS